ncbi:hypothetical protein EZV62_009509 [Acer yangbiense]|uniref:Uncharacterized protein n=1 Tax=Acer yangbiense TaxID=1000413 RepID=A0A5C7I0B7_9ROSI|nr:hypothetical protein EZV62_009509 [Acer yangbiense]
MSQDSSIGHLEPPDECCIYKVPQDFRIRKNVYTPLLVSIGPLHFGKVRLAAMEKEKVTCYEKFCSRLRGNWLDKFMSFLQLHETRIRNTYRYVSGTCPLSSDVFQKMVLYDSIFILEFFFSCHEGEKSGIILNHSLVKESLIRRDLLLLENQVPYFILGKLYKLICDSGFYISYPSLLSLSCKFLGIYMPWDEHDEIKVAHYTDLLRSAVVGIFPRDLERSTGKFEAIPTATLLKKSGVRFEPGGCILDMKCTRRNFLVWPCVLTIPHVEVNMSSESIFGNIRALENCGYESMSNHFTNFLYFMRSLINSEEDLDLLMTEKVVSNKLGDEAEVVKLFERVADGIAEPEHDLWCGISDNLNAQVTFRDV